MANTSIIFYGKPQSWESYEFNKSGYKRGDIGTPALKPRIEDGAVLHYYVQNDYYYLELYEFATAYDTGRSGVVIGVCVKSDSALAVSEKNISILSELLTYYKDKALTKNLQFNTYDLLDIVENFNLNEAIYETIELNDTPPKNCVEGVKLLFLENYKNNIGSINQYVSACSNAYVSQDNSIYKAAINEKIWRDADKQIITVNEDGKLVASGKTVVRPRQDSGGVVITGGSTSTGSWKDREVERQAERKRQKRKARQNLMKFIVLPAFVICAFFFGGRAIMDSWKTGNGGGASVAVVTPPDDEIVTPTATTDEPPETEDKGTTETVITPTMTFSISDTYKKIENSIPNLRQFITLSQGNKSNVQFAFSPSGYVKMNGNNLEVIQQDETDKQVTITASITVNGQNLTKNETITVKAKKATTVVVTDCKIGNRTVEQVLAAFKTDKTSKHASLQSLAKQIMDSDCATQTQRDEAKEIWIGHCHYNEELLDDILNRIENNHNRNDAAEVVRLCGIIENANCATQSQKTKATAIKNARNAVIIQGVDTPTR